MPEDGHAAWAAAGLSVLESIPLRRSADVRGVILQALCECSFFESTTAVVMPIYHRPMEKTFAACSFSDANGASNVLSFGTKFRERPNRSQSFLIQRKEIG